MIYLNHAATSWPKPDPVSAAVGHALERSPLEWAERFDAARARVAAWLGCADPTRILLTPGCTSALAVAIADLPWQQGDTVITSAMEHHAVTRPVEALTARGVEPVVIPPGGGHIIDLDRLEDRLSSRRPRLVAVSWATNTTGEIAPIEEIIDLAHEHDALVLVDAAQAAGWLDIDVETLEIDMLAFAGHKGPQAPWGVGGLYLAPHVQTHGPPATCAIDDAMRDGEARAAPRAMMPSGCDVGSCDRIALEGLVAGIEWLSQPALHDHLERSRTQIDTLAEHLEALPGVELHVAARSAPRVPTLAMTSERLRADELAERLRAHDVVASGGIQCAPQAHETLGTAPDGVLRLSVGHLTADSEVESAMDVLTAMLL